MTFGDVIDAVLNVRIFDAVAVFLAVAFVFTVYSVWAELLSDESRRLKEIRRRDKLERMGKPLR